MNLPVLKVSVISPTDSYQGVVLSLSSHNTKGPFDVLPQHTNFITIIKDKVALRLDERHQKEFAVTKGVLSCHEDEVTVYLGL